ncbi:unnamed protein product [Jaminaea pallidilutea]
MSINDRRSSIPGQEGTRDTLQRPRTFSSEYLSGIALLLLVVILWTASNFLTNGLQVSGWDKPFALAYANTASFTLYLLPLALSQINRRRGAVSPRSAARDSFWAKHGFLLPQEASGGYAPIGSGADYGRSASPSGQRLDGPSTPALGRRSGSHSRLPALTLRETFVLAMQFTFVWFAANWALNAGLGLTSVASGTTLSSASGFFTLLLGSFIGVERLTPTKVLGVVISFAGVVLVTHADSIAPDTSLVAAPINAPLGDALCLVSAVLYALYVILLQARIAHPSRISMPLFFGFVGLLNVTLLWPVGLLLNYTGVEVFQWPQDKPTWAGIAINMAITFVSDFAYLLAMLKTAPLIATVGLSLTIPMSVLIDIVKGTHSGGWVANIGSLAVLLSFVAIGWDDRAVDNDESDSRDDESRGRSPSREERMTRHPT